MNLGPAINHSFIWTEVLNDTKKTQGKARFDVRKGGKKKKAKYFDGVLWMELCSFHQLDCIKASHLWLINSILLNGNLVMNGRTERLTGIM